MQIDDEAHNLGSAKLLLGSGDIQVMTLDGLVSSRQPKLIKVDAEGKDLDVLKGSRSTLAESAPIVCVEAASAQDFSAIVDFLLAFGLLPVATYNYTPTHVFRAWGSDGDRAVLESFARSAGLQYVRYFDLNNLINSRFKSLSERISTLEQSLVKRPRAKPKPKPKRGDEIDER
jgi:hypothetical protein